jgi:DDE superfamily endonuclease
MPGVPERCARSYVRYGTTTLFAALDVASGVIMGKCYKRHQTVEFLKFLEEIDHQVPEGLDIHIVMDNYPTHVLPEAAAPPGRHRGLCLVTPSVARPAGTRS